MPHLNDDTCDVPKASLCDKEIDYMNKHRIKKQPYLFSLDECLVVASCLDEEQLKIFKIQ